MPTRVLIAGVSTRAAAESAATAGFDVTAIDAFADLDQHPSVRARALARFTADGAARASRDVDCDAVAYLSSFENHPDAISTLAAGRELWGNAPAVLRRVRDPLLVMRALRARACAVPEATCDDAGTRGKEWLVKPLASGGGHGVRPWRRGTRLPRDCYLQEHIDGTPGSVVFVAAAGRVVPLGISRSLAGEEHFGAVGFRYCGNILAHVDAVGNAGLINRACGLARAVAQEFDLVGVNGVDFVARDGVPYAIEVNPRWCASMELVERGYGLSVFGAHAAACTTGALPEFDLVQARRDADAIGKAVIFARRDIEAGDTSVWLADGTVRDIPHPGERIAAGHPVCTVFATGRDAAACHAALVRRAEGLYAELSAWDSGFGIRDSS